MTTHAIEGTNALASAVGHTLAIRRVALTSLALDPANARLHPEHNIEAIKSSLARFGQVEPLVVLRATGRIIGGNGRLVAMKALGWTECDIVEVELSATEATALGIALNRTAELAEWDTAALAQLLGALRSENAIEGLGFDRVDIDALINEVALASKVCGEDPGPQTPPVTPTTRTGDLWLLGDHRLLCGDSTKSEDVARVMNGAKAALLATDPPYLVDYQGGNHPQSFANKAEVKDKHWDDYVDPQTSVDFFGSFLRVALPHCVERVPVYQWHATRRQSLVEVAWKQNGLLVHQTVVWVKARAVLTRSHYMWQHEPCFYGWVEGNMPEPDRRPPPAERTVWEIDQVGQQDGIHPTQKPLEIFERPIRFHTREGEIVLEPFSGSGTQIVAAERLHRRCHALEISPAFVDAAVRRWELLSGRAAVLENTRATFACVSTERGAA
ncbi:MAG: DNA modification methylase [Planctomycetes bacterium]|nr:DNA modification methylase [Planctomycetota bacterium]